MKAAQINGYGDISVIQIKEVEKLHISENQVLVRVHAASLNPYDTKVRAGNLKEMIPLELPITLGGDIAGEVVEIGDRVTSAAAGDKVYGQAQVVAKDSGAFAEYAATAASHVAKIPAKLGWNEAASLPLVGVSAVQALLEHINLRHGQTILIQGGSGGIGSMAIQIAKHLGAQVTATASGEGIAFARQLGADNVIDYKAERFEAGPNNYDAVLDAVGGNTYERSLEVVKKGGVIVTMAAQVDDEQAQKRGITAIQQMTGVNTERLDKLSKLVEEGVITPQVDMVYPLDQIQEAFEAREGEKVLGKVVLEIS